MSGITERLADWRHQLKDDRKIGFRRGKRLLSAVEAVLALHSPEEYSGGGPESSDGVGCSGCALTEPEGVMPDWPCPTVQAITRALGGDDE